MKNFFSPPPPPPQNLATCIHCCVWCESKVGILNIKHQIIQLFLMQVHVTGPIRLECMVVISHQLQLHLLCF